MDRYELIDALEGIVYTLQTACKDITELYGRANPFNEKQRRTKVSMTAALADFRQDLSQAKDYILNAQELIGAYTHLYSSSLAPFRAEFDTIADGLTEIERARQQQQVETSKKGAGQKAVEFVGELIGLELPNGQPRPPVAHVRLSGGVNDSRLENVRVRVILNDAQCKVARTRIGLGKCTVSFTGTVELDSAGVLINHTHDWVVIVVEPNE